MGSTMKPTIFNERVATALRNWHHTAKKHIKQNKGSVTPLSSRPTTPTHHMSPVHLLRHYRSEVDSFQNSPRKSNFEADRWDTDSPSPSHTHFHHTASEGSSSHHHQIEMGQVDRQDHDVELTDPSSTQVITAPEHHIMDAPNKEFSFDKRLDV